MKTLFISAALCLFTVAAFAQQDGKDGVKKQPGTVTVNPNAVHPQSAHPVKQTFPVVNPPAKSTKPAPNTNTNGSTDKK